MQHCYCESLVISWFCITGGSSGHSHSHGAGHDHNHGHSHQHDDGLGHSHTGGHGHAHSIQDLSVGLAVLGNLSKICFTMLSFRS